MKTILDMVEEVEQEDSGSEEEQTSMERVTSGMERLLGNRQGDDQCNKENLHPLDNGRKECMWCALHHDKDKCVSFSYQTEASTKNMES